jgi:hypothetical protein
VRRAVIIRCVLGLGLVGCSPPSTTQAEGKPAPRAVAPDPEPVACRPSPDGGAWARFPGITCDFELYEEVAAIGAEGDEPKGPPKKVLVLASLAPEAPAPVRGEVPEPCRTSTCVYHGTLTPVGPLLVAVVPSPSSEMPSDVLLLVTHGERLASTSLWEGAGEPVESDFTIVGPAHALAPFVCGQALALLAVERLDMVGLPPPATLRAREGRLDPAALVATGQATPAGAVDRASCEPVDLPVP